MATVRCVVCGENIISAGFGEESRVCPHCGRHIERVFYFPATEQLFAKALEARKIMDFSLAEKYFENIIASDPDCADAYLGMAMCRYTVVFGGENGDEPFLTEFRRKKFSGDRCFIAALEHSGEETAADMRSLAAKIDRKIEEMAILSDKTPYDVILCCRETIEGKDAVSPGYAEALLLAESMQKNKLRVYILTEKYDRMNAAQVCDRFNAFGSARVYINCLCSAKDAQSEFYENAYNSFLRVSPQSRIRTSVAAVRPFRGKLPKFFDGQRVSAADMPEDKTELALNVRIYCDSLCRIGETTVLPQYDESEFSQRLKAVFALIESGDFSQAHGAAAALYTEQPENVSVLWAMLLIKRGIKNTAELLSSGVPLKDDVICNQILSLCDEGVKNRISKIDAAIFHNIHINFLSAAKQGKKEAAKRLADYYASVNPAGALNPVHSALLKSMDGSFSPEILGALLYCISSYYDLPFSAGAENVRTITDAYTDFSNSMLRFIKERFAGLKDSKTKLADADLLVRCISCLCEPAVYFEAKYKVKISSIVPLAGDSAFSRYFFLYSQLLPLEDRPDENQKKLLDFCVNTASLASPESAYLFNVQSVKTAAEKKQKHRRIKKLKKTTAEIIVPQEVPAAEKKNGSIQVIFGFLLVLFVMPVLGAAILINLMPDRLLQFDRTLFVATTVSAVTLWGILFSVLAKKLYSARNNRRHTHIGKAAITVFSSVTVILSLVSLSLTVFSAATFGARMNVIYLSSGQEFSYISNYPDGNYVLSSDIDLSDMYSAVIQRFSGTLDGAGHTVSGYTEKAASVLSRNSGTIKNIIFKDSVFRGGLVYQNTGNLTDLSFINCEFGRAMVEENTGIITGELTDCKFYGGCMIKENHGEINGVKLNNIYASQDNADVLSVGNSSYSGVIACSNSGFISDCELNDCVLSVTADQIIAGGFCGINSGNITGCTVKNLEVSGKAAVFGGFSGRNAGVSMNNSVEISNINIKILRSFGGFSGSGTHAISECSVVIYGNVDMIDSYDENRAAGAFIGHSTGEILSCSASGSLKVKSDSYCKNTLYVGGLSGVQEGGDMYRCFTDAGLDVYQSGMYGSTEVAIGGIVGRLSNCSLQESERRGRLTVGFASYDAGATSRAAIEPSKFQPEFYVGGVAGMVVSDDNNKNEVLTDIRLSGIITVDDAGGGSLKFGAFTGIMGCAHVFENSYSLALCTVNSTGRTPPEIGITAGRISDVEKISGVFFAGRLSVTGDNLVPVSFAPGKEKLCTSCYVTDSVGTVTTDIPAVPGQTFRSPMFIYNDLGWSDVFWQSDDGRLPVLVCFSE